MKFYNERFLKVLEESIELLDEFDDDVKESLMTLGNSYKESLLSEKPIPLIEYATLYEGVMSFVRYVGWFYPYFKKDEPKEDDDFLNMIFDSFKRSPYWTAEVKIKL